MTGAGEPRRGRLGMGTAAPLAATAGGAGEPGLDIRAVKAYALLERACGRSYAVLRLETSSGLVGYGECPELSSSELEQIRHTVVGKPATAFEVIRRHLGGRAGAAVNIALLDIVGKLTKAPVYQLLGGPTRYKVRALAPLRTASGAAVLDSLKRAQAAGFRAVSVPLPAPAAPNQGEAFVQTARKMFGDLRQAVGSAVEFVLDGGGAFSPGDAANLASAFETFHLLWFDEPCAPIQTGALRRLAAENVTPIGLGRRLEEPGQFQDLLREDAVNVLRPDIGRHGLTGIRRLAAMAETYYVAVAPYHDGGPVATAAALHLAASLPNFFIQQIPFPEDEEDRRMRAELIGGGTVESVSDGFAALPAGPGLGITVSQEALEKYQERP